MYQAFSRPLVLITLLFSGTGLATTVDNGQSCGDSYISADKTCHVGNGIRDTTSSPSTQPRQAVWFANCQAAKAAGKINIRRSNGAYSSHLDRDNDGVACEANGDDDDNYDFNPFTLPPPSPQATRSAGNAAATAPTYNAVSPQAPDPLALKVYRVVQVLDDGRIVLNADYQDFTTQLIGLKIPEPQRALAVTWLRKQLPVNSLVYVQQDKVKYTPTHTLWVYLWQDRQLVNTQLVLTGLATTDEAEPNTTYLTYFQAAQAAAKAAGQGLWKSGGL